MSSVIIFRIEVSNPVTNFVVVAWEKHEGLLLYDDTFGSLESHRGRVVHYENNGAGKARAIRQANRRAKVYQEIAEFNELPHELRAQRPTSDDETWTGLGDGLIIVSPQRGGSFVVSVLDPEREQIFACVAGTKDEAFHWAAVLWRSYQSAFFTCNGCRADLRKPGTVDRKGWVRGHYDASGAFVSDPDAEFSEEDAPDVCALGCGEDI